MMPNRRMSERKPWSRQHLLIAMNLYCKLPFGRLHQRAPEIIRLAQLLGRTPGSVAMKLCNFASLDPALRQRGIRGLQGASAADRRIWDEFHHDWEQLGAESEALTERLFSGESTEADAADTSLKEVRDSDKPSEFPSGILSRPTEAERTVRVRLGQEFFRQTVLASYGVRCCITGNPVPELLIASHILPWSSFPEQRVNPRNGLCLARTHDAAFDQGLVTFDDDWRLVVSRDLKEYLPNESLERHFLAYEGASLRLPEKFVPEDKFLAWHREKTFRGK